MSNHENKNRELFDRLPEGPHSFVEMFDTTSEQLAALAAKARPGLFIVYHAAISWQPSTAPSGDGLGVLATGELHSTPDVLHRERERERERERLAILGTLRHRAGPRCVVGVNTPPGEQ